MSFWWLSFCDPDRPKGMQFLGGCIVEADSLKDAIQVAWRHDCNPGGEVMGHKILPEYECNVSRFEINQLLSEQQIRLLDTTH